MALMRPRANQVNFDVTDISDPLIRINSGQSGANDKDIGIVFERGSDTNVAVMWDESADELVIVNTAEDGSTGGNVTISSYANIRANAFYGDGSNLTGVYGDSDVAAYLSANGYATSSSIIASITDSAPTTLDTLNELAAALGDDANFSTTISTQIGAKLDSSSYTAADVLTKIKTVDGASSGLDADLLDGQEGSYYLNYNNFSNTPTIPTNNNQLTNGAGYITSADGGNAATLDSLDSTQFLRSDASDSTTGQLTVNNSSAYDTEGNLNVYGTGKNSIIVQTSDNASDRGMAFRNSGGAYIGYINMENRGSNTGDLVFGVNGTTATSVNDVAERMRITKEGNIVSAGGEFQGLATTAQYADLAEKYTTDQEYPIGTAMCVGGEAETTAAGNDCITIGVISEKPAYLMNSDSEGQAIGLKGRVPVRVKGAVRKGQAVYAWENGVCSTVATMGMVGVALESNDNEEEKLVECVLKV